MIVDRKFDPSRSLDAEQAILRDPRYREMDDTCRNIPPAPGCAFVGKTILNNRPGISYYFYTDDTRDRNEGHFVQVMQENGWDRQKNDLLSYVLSYKKGEVEVDITIDRIGPDINLAINCKLPKNSLGNSSRPS
jgi:hypothetical protein